MLLNNKRLKNKINLKKIYIYCTLALISFIKIYTYIKKFHI